MSGDKGEQPQSGVWVASYSDRSSARVFETEIDALRHAVEWSMQVEFIPYGCDVFTGEAP